MTIKVKLVTKPMKTADLESGQHGNPKAVAADVTDVTPKPTKGKAMNHPDHPKKHVPLTPEEFAAGKTPNSGKLKKDGSPVPGQDAAHDAERAAERAAEAAAGGGDDDLPEPTPEPTPPPVV